MLLDKLEAYYAYFSQRKAGWFILLSALFFTATGLIILASASLSFIKSENYFCKQLLWCTVGVPFFLIGASINLNLLKKCGTWLLVFFAIALVVVLIPGVGKLVNGSRRWISIGGINVQISEFAKLAVVVWLARYLEQHVGSEDKFFTGFLTPLIVSGIICGLILLEPDYGTAILIGMVVFTLLFLFGTRLLYLLVATVGGLLSISILIYLNPTRLRRIVAFLDVENNKLEGAYQLWQGMLGFVSGGLLGRGVGQGRQQLVYLPEAHTDFIFPVFSEEFGSIAAIAVLMLYAAFFLVASHCARRLHDNFAKFLAHGICLTVIYQVIINVGVVTGLLPTKGMVLPFISYGGSSLVLLFLMIGLLLNCCSLEMESEEVSSPAARR
jgi:cell division protein FtsW